MKSSPDPIAIVGRTEELDALRGFLAEVAKGRLGVAFVEGEPGIGKTRLIEAAVGAGDDFGFRSFLGRCEELESGRPFGPLIDALGCHDRVTESIAAQKVSNPGFPTHDRVVDELVDLVESVGLQHPVLLTIEDVHWSDSSTLHALHALTRRVPDLPIAILMTARPLPRPQALEGFLRRLDDERLTRIALGPLDSASVSELASELLEARLTGGLIDALDRTGGNPFLLEELLDALRSEGDIVINKGVAELAGASLPPGLRLLIIRRLQFLTKEALEVLRLATILGTSFSVNRLSSVTRRPVVELLPLIEECLKADVLQEEGRRLRFRHDLIHEALYLDIPPSARAGLHLEVARTLDQAGAQPHEFAQHYSLGAAPDNRSAVQALRAASRLSSLPSETRVTLLTRALELVEDSGELRDETTAELADALVWGGKPAEGTKLARDVIDRRPSPGVARELRLTLSRGLWLQAAWQELLDVTDSWLDATNIDDVERGLFLAQRSMAGCFCNRPVTDIVADADDALNLGETAANAEVIVSALIALIFARGDALGEGVEIPLAQRAVEVAETSRLPEVHRLQPRMFLGQALQAALRFDEAEQALLAGLQERERTGTLWDLPLYQRMLAMIYFKTGRWDDSAAAAEASISASIDSGTVIGVADAHAIRGEIAYYRGDLEDAEAHFEAAQNLSAASPRSMDSPSTLTYHFAMAQGEVDWVVKEVRLALENEGELGLTLQERLLVELIPFLRDAQQMPLASRVVHEFEAYIAPRNDQMEVHVVAGRAALEDDPALLLEALKGLQTAGLWESFIVAERLARCLCLEGKGNQARRYFELALGGYERMGAARLTTRAVVAMRRCGLSLDKGAVRKRARFGWEALTKAELNVLPLVMKGMTNRQIAEHLFVSRYTVQTHLKNMFMKLGVNSRVELAAMYAQRSDVDTQASSSSGPKI